nr:integrase, catalytic region, zinc finger, CCHC-type, peptidase aspartic, catalytic [Tanacetum cinerariifolium]
NELHAERLAMNANQLALVATAQANQDPYYQISKSQKSYAPSSKPSISTRSHTTTRHKGKEIAKPITPPSKSASEEDNDLEQAQRDKDITSSNSRNKNVDTTPRYKNDNESGQFGNQRTMNVAGARENVGSLVVQQSGIQCFNCKEFGHLAKECRKPKRIKDSVYHKEKMLLCKQAEKSVPLQAEQYDWLADTNEEIDDNVILDSPDMCDDDIQNDQNDIESDDEHVALANLKLDVDENKKIQKQLKKANTTLAQELKECKTILAETSKTLGESNSVWDSCLVAIQNKQSEFEMYKAFNDRTVDYDKLEQRVKNDTVWNGQASDVFRKEREQYIKIQDLKVQLQDKNTAISELKKLIEKGQEKSVETKFDKPSVVRQPNAQRIPKPSVLGTVRFGNDQFAPILGYRDLVQRNIMINRVYYVKGLNHNLFSVKKRQEKDNIETKPDKIRQKREAWKSPEMSKTNHSRESRKREEIQSQRTNSDKP